MNAISQALIPNITKNYYDGKFKDLSKKLNQALTISLILGIIFTIILTTCGSIILKLMYNTEKGLNYIRILSPLFIFHYLEQPLLSTLQAMNKAKENMKISTINMLIRTIGLAILCSLKIKLYGLIIAIGINIMFTCIYSWFKINKIISNKQKTFI